MGMATKTEEFQGVMDSSLVQTEMCCPQLLPEDGGRIFSEKKLGPTYQIMQYHIQGNYNMIYT